MTLKIHFNLGYCHNHDRDSWVQKQAQNQMKVAPVQKAGERHSLIIIRKVLILTLFISSLSERYSPLSRHYQKGFDFKTVNIHRTVGMYFFVFACNGDDIVHDLQRS